jgi:hypothetical protein
MVSDAIPFIEYDLHRQLIYKLRLMGMNCIVRLKLTLTVGENLILGVATGAPPPFLLMLTDLLLQE